MGILSTDGVKRRPVVVAQDDGTEAIAIHSIGLLCLSWDHRAVDGAYAAAFVARIVEILATRDWSAELVVRRASGQVARPGPLRGGPRSAAGAARSAGRDEYLLMLEHPGVVTLGLRGDMSHVLADPEAFGAESPTNRPGR